jgi:hypothetical protein
MNFEADIRDHILRVLPYDESDHNTMIELYCMDVTILLTYYLNWFGRFIEPRPRKVHQSKELLSNPLSKNFSIPLAAIIQKIENGTNITYHLSERVTCGYTSANFGYRQVSRKEKILREKSLNRKKDLDLLLNDWKIYHLHLSTNEKSNGFFSGDELLFAVFTKSDAYLIDILTHGKWADDHLIRVIVSNWPHENLVWPLRLSGVPPTNEEERWQLRSLGATLMVGVDGKVFMATNGGISTAGTSMRAGMTADQIIYALKQFRNLYQSNPDELLSHLYQSDPDLPERRGLVLPESPSLRFVFLSNAYGILEEKTCSFIQLGTL